MNQPSAAITAPSVVEDSELSALRVVSTIAQAREALAPSRLRGHTIGFVPTMGALHQGHLSLIAQAAKQCHAVVVSVFVNPTQFDEQADLVAYPRRLERDVALAQQAGAHILFAPSVEQMYPHGFASVVEVGRIAQTLEGETRGASHFAGMCTVVCKLLNIVQPTIAYFGQKDAQQVAVVKRLVADLNLPSSIVTLPTVREHDGLAMSSRNARLSPPEREQALGLHAALEAAEERAILGERSCPALIAAASEAIARYGIEPEYVEIVDEDSFERVETIGDQALMVIAARVGQTRLIDNAHLRCPSALAQRGQDRGQTHTRPSGRTDTSPSAQAHTQRPVTRPPHHTKET